MGASAATRAEGGGVSRREAILLSGAAALGVVMSGAPGRGEPLAVRPIPSSGETIPVVGIGTWQAFDVGDSSEDRRPLEAVLAAFAARGGRVVDSSPMYGRSESVVGEISEKLGLRRSLFFATKVWTTGRKSGIDQMTRSLEALRTQTIDLMQVHNLVDAPTHLPTLFDWKARGIVRYVGVTHYTEGALADVERFVGNERLDFVQINYSVAEPEAGRRLLPLAAERGVAVIANRPFGGGDLMRRAAARPLPPWAGELRCTSWAQIFLKWILADPAVTCAIPGTRRVEHLDDNLGAASGPLPDARERALIARAAAEL